MLVRRRLALQSGKNKGVRLSDVSAQFRAAAVGVAAVLVTACGSGDQQVRTAREATSPPVGETIDIQVRCNGGLPFPSSALSGPVGIERADGVAEAALREVIGDQHGIEPVPTNGYRRLYVTESEAQFGSGTKPLMVITVRRRDNGLWSYASSGDCTPRVVRPGLEPTEWDFAEPSRPGPTSTKVDVLVRGLACSSGVGVDGRLQEPEVRYGDDAVTIAFFAAPLPPTGQLQLCPGAPPARRRVILSEPLGDRRLLDAGVFPPRDPAADRRSR